MQQRVRIICLGLTPIFLVFLLSHGDARLHTCASRAQDQQTCAAIRDLGVDCPATLSCDTSLITPLTILSSEVKVYRLLDYLPQLNDHTSDQLILHSINAASNTYKHQHATHPTLSTHRSFSSVDNDRHGCW